MSLGNFLYIKKALGKNEKLITVYKIRTMYHGADQSPDSFRLDNLGKPNNNPRVIPSRKILRKYWIDELPQLYNLFTGELGFVGIRPKSKKEWLKYPESFKEHALKYKPGLFAVPYSNGNIKNFDQFIKIQQDYLKRKDSSPFLTDAKYFFRIIYNIIVEGVRSK